MASLHYMHSTPCTLTAHLTSIASSEAKAPPCSAVSNQQSSATVSLFWTLALFHKLSSRDMLKTLHWSLPGGEPNSNSLLPTVLFSLALLMQLALCLTALGHSTPVSSNQCGFAIGHPHETGPSCLLFHFSGMFFWYLFSWFFNSRFL